MSLLLGEAPAKQLQVRPLSNSSVTDSLLEKLSEELMQDLLSQHCGELSLELKRLPSSLTSEQATKGKAGRDGSTPPERPVRAQ